jgi:hypothetical protein
MEKEGVLRNPIANAMPDGIHLENQSCFLPVYVLMAERSPKAIEKMIMNIALFSGSWPSPG